MTVRLHELTASAAPAWDAFVAASPEGTFFHRAAWARVIHEAFGHTARFTYAEQDGAITGVLPLVHVKTLLFGNALISTPFCVYGGPLAADAESATALGAHAVALMRQMRARWVEFRFRDTPPEVEQPPEWVERPGLYVTFRKPITGNDEENLKAIPRKQRAMVRKGIANGLTSRCDLDVATQHDIYAESVRNLGTPVFSERYFRILAGAFRDDMDVITVMHNETPVASVMNFYFRDEVLPYYGGGARAARRLAGNDFMYWEVMRRAAERGYRLFDFGRSKVGTGSYAFKHNWGFEPSPLHYRFHLASGASIPDHNPLNPKYRLFIAGWKRQPVWLSKLTGPCVIRGLG
jgi:FemAB-related protein (PEP-CTERM system-associated)